MKKINNKTENTEKSDKKQQKEKQKRELDIEINNVKNEIGEIVEKCTRCGMCRGLCPVFRVMREEYYSPRGKTILFSEEVFDKIVFQCNLCKSCERKCPLGIRVSEAVRKSRELLVLKGKELEENKEMIKNIRNTGNPFGKNPDEKGKLYCC